MLRGLVFAALMVFIRLIQGAAINAWETKALLISVTLVVIFAIIAVIWGFFDGRSDAKANPDPDRRQDLAMRRLLAGLFAGIVSGAVAWLSRCPANCPKRGVWVTTRRTPRCGWRWNGRCASSVHANARGLCCATSRTVARPRPPRCSASPSAPSRPSPSGVWRGCGPTPPT